MRTAIDCFAQYGYAGTSIDRIAKAAGVTKGALYYHFRDKAQLRSEAVAERIEAFEELVLEATGPMLDPRDALRKVYAICAQIARTDNQRRFILTMMVEAIDTDDALSAQFLQMLKRFRAFHGQLIRRGQEEGIFRTDVDPRTASETMVGSILGAEVQFYQDPQGFDLDRALDAQIDQLFAWLAPRETMGGDQDQGGSRNHV